MFQNKNKWNSDLPSLLLSQRVVQVFTIFHFWCYNTLLWCCLSFFLLLFVWLSLSCKRLSLERSSMALRGWVEVALTTVLFSCWHEFRPLSVIWLHSPLSLLLPAPAYRIFPLHSETWVPLHWSFPLPTSVYPVPFCPLLPVGAHSVHYLWKWSLLVQSFFLHGQNSTTSPAHLHPICPFYDKRGGTLFTGPGLTLALSYFYFQGTGFCHCTQYLISLNTYVLPT